MLDLYRDVFKSLNEHEVKYLVIGGIAVGVHAQGRVTHDLDIIIEATEANADRLLRALEAARILTAGLTSVGGLLSHEITIFRDYVQTKTPGLDFSGAWSRRVEIEYEGIRFPVVSRRDLIAAKEAAGRPVDQEDLRALRATEGGDHPR